MEGAGPGGAWPDFRPGRSAGDGYQAAEGEVRVGLLCLGERQLDAAQALLEAVRAAEEVVHRVAAVEVRHVLHQVVVLAAVRVRARHPGLQELLIHREGPVGGGRGGYAGIRRAAQYNMAVVIDRERLRI